MLLTCRVVPINGIVEVTLTTDGCDEDVKFIEHVEALVTMSASVRGQVTLTLSVIIRIDELPHSN